jgi:hypothetical protein
MPLPSAPDWLAKRDGTLAPGIRDHIAFVTISGKPHYKIEVRPAKGKYASAVTQTVNGRPIDDAAAEYPTPDAAFAGGLSRLKDRLGW